MVPPGDFPQLADRCSSKPRYYGANPDGKSGFITRFGGSLSPWSTIKTAFAFYVKAGGRTVDQTIRTLKEYLVATSAQADVVYGAVLEDPGLTALFADELKEVTE